MRVANLRNRINIREKMQNIPDFYVIEVKYEQKKKENKKLT